MLDGVALVMLGVADTEM
ncbi:hypothetical protein J007_05369 [Cryptococcus neoformans]|nr:hypothetical protein J007_05369 [Cryptococcus neoformans var. grubii]